MAEQAKNAIAIVATMPAEERRRRLGEAYAILLELARKRKAQGTQTTAQREVAREERAA